MRKFVASCGVALLLLAACGGGGSPGRAPTSSPGGIYAPAAPAQPTETPEPKPYPSPTKDPYGY